MGKLIVVALATLFVCGCVAVKVPAVWHPIANNHYGVSWMALLFVGCILGGFKLIHGK